MVFLFLIINQKLKIMAKLPHGHRTEKMVIKATQVSNSRKCFNFLCRIKKQIKIKNSLKWITSLNANLPNFLWNTFDPQIFFRLFFLFLLLYTAAYTSVWPKKQKILFSSQVGFINKILQLNKNALKVTLKKWNGSDEGKSLSPTKQGEKK